jgi:hypothetical protein
MKLTFLLAALILSAVPSRATPDLCAPLAAQLKIGYRLSYERPGAGARAALLDKAECYMTISDAGIPDFGEPDAPANPSPVEARLRFWSDSSPYEVRAEFSGGWARVFLVKREGRYSKDMAAIDQVEADALSYTTFDYSGNVADAEFPERTVASGLRRTAKAGRVLLSPFSR